jgi:hypothetical protein
MRDLHRHLAAVLAVAPAVLSATATSAAIDLRGHESAEIIVPTGAIVSSGAFSITVTECDTSDGTFTEVAAEDLLGGADLPASLAATSVYQVGYRGSKRYIKVELTKASGTSIAASATVVLGHPHIGPA